MNRQNVILALGLLLIIANGIASGELTFLWHSISGLPTGNNDNLTDPSTGHYGKFYAPPGTPPPNAPNSNVGGPVIH